MLKRLGCRYDLGWAGSGKICFTSSRLAEAMEIVCDLSVHNKLRAFSIRNITDWKKKT